MTRVRGKLVLFDIDGTLLDTHGLGRSVVRLARVTGRRDELGMCRCEVLIACAGQVMGARGAVCGGDSGDFEAVAEKLQGFCRSGRRE